ncbi:hypothetical protein, variant [Verruconis gallopava]|uniref:Calcineurin-like phosphoesterase domain-containing protein n=1 Tax=Verruconis gallopava TaxID=253628 RepID=A0A0D2A341_9PEZI|nr:hypothetical protein, variant [Verruconis gallopava]KIW01208.1 hypothetical protein, variant [Verruconis gallopava]
MPGINPQRRRTRIVCISDTHNQTPQLPKGDVLVHAGDLTNQGSFSELKKTVAWLEKADFEIKIVVGGNHDITLDTEFYGANWTYFHNQRKQDEEDCRALLQDSPSITYLRHEPVHIKLTASTGPQTHFKVFGSPYSPAHGLWAFGYTDAQAAQLWDQVPVDTDVLVTHTPPKGHCDRTVTKSGRAGCEHLLRRLWRVRPPLHVCGHLHEGRGAEIITWNDGSDSPRPESHVLCWKDPGAGEGNKKQSILSLTPRDGRSGSQHGSPLSAVAASTSKWHERPARASTTAGNDVAAPAADDPDPETAEETGPVHGEDSARGRSRTTTCVVNAAIMKNSFGGPKQLNKPIVVDIDFPVLSDG